MYVADKKSVLVVDDEPFNLTTLTGILSHEYTVYAAKSGQDAINAAEKHLPDVILLDILMPEMDGYAVLAALKNSERTRDIPVIFATGLGHTEDEEKGWVLGAADYIAKPFSPAVVRLRVQNQMKIRDRLHEVQYDIMKYVLTNDALGIALWDMDVVAGDPVNPNNQIAWSPELRHLLGFSDESDFPDVLESWSERLHPEDKERTLGAFTGHLVDHSGKTPFDIEYRLMVKSGVYRHFHAFGTTLRDSGGIPLRVAGALRDIDRSKQAEETLKRRAEIVKALNKSTEVFCLHAEETFDEVMASGIRPFADAAGLDRVCIFNRKDTKAGKRPAISYVWDRAQGGTSPDLIKSTAGLIDAGLDGGVASEWISILSGGGYINKRVCDMSVKEAAFLSNFGIRAIFMAPIFTHGDFWGVVTLQDHTSNEYFTDGSTETDLMQSAAHQFANAVIKNEMVQSIRDSSVQLEDALAQATAASKAKGDFLSTMSHEMRTPLNAIIGMTAIARKAESIEEKNRALNKIGDASSHLLGVINDVLDMAKIEANKLEIAPVEYNFKKMLQKVITIVNFRADEKQQILTVHVDDAIPSFLIGDDQRLAQIIANLLSNAVKFTPEKGNIHLEASFVGEIDGNCELRIVVSDSGIGISVEQQEKLFNTFEQATSGTSREYGGTGLGLAISKRVIELMGGGIDVESELGKGAKFILTVKALRGRKSPGAAREQGESIGNTDGEFAGKRMLLAEDIEINREILIEILKDTGLAVDCAENGRKALDMIEAAPDKYDIVFMDLQMPKMDGLEASRRIRALPARRRLPIIALTANVFKDDIAACLAAGMDDHLGKPIDIDRVFEKLRNYLH